ncbi:S26 family signal peptidase [Dactylosporangium fulvum]|uniref:S26 family signal peptidase n=1 Tax=Dactylosporangium fulvum TaxID=53359 RepID=A0ABY5WA79_9ACTN|nr:S26 family signal peptidase [Dactylosporangium fulvum]UWP85603.1 S26 family signal peptidase [Dactylosporangium fulvum]
MPPYVWLLLAVAAAAGIALVRRRLLVVTVAGDSMSPSYGDGDVLLAVQRRRFAVGDVVVFRNPLHPNAGLEKLVKRLVAVAGDPVPAEIRSAAGCDVVPPGKVAVRGDNVDSVDSRRLGLIPAADVQAVVRLRLQEAAS